MFRDLEGNSPTSPPRYYPWKWLYLRSTHDHARSPYQSGFFLSRFGRIWFTGLESAGLMAWECGTSGGASTASFGLTRSTGGVTDTGLQTRLLGGERLSGVVISLLNPTLLGSLSASDIRGTGRLGGILEAGSSRPIWTETFGSAWLENLHSLFYCFDYFELGFLECMLQLIIPSESSLWR